MNKPVFKTILLFIVVCFTLQGGYAFCQPAASKATVVIDAAHGGADSGVIVSDKVQEKEITLKVALLLQKELAKSSNIQVVLTRDRDMDLALTERIKKIAAAQPRIMVSIHVNAGFYKNAKGLEIYFPGFKPVKTAKDESSAIISDMTKNRHLNESVRLAQNIQKQLESVFPKENRGLREAPLQLLEDVKIPAVVVEMGFATNAENRKKILDEKTQQDIARALARGIRDSL
ncbi:MAG: N-acetylmuramoyl-L-alanine amidase [Syntrophales bacterium]|nr:N-acetylmuramoyl-L-alanine amidase [Syntrophales bacterium]